mmetsp:Transcript_120790/g.346978  ORF Transcript_120790/g.346978 Transcript_120790/m.346978 type:complete len:833 (-) Transcript_120790:293-2791(-)
MPAPWGPKPPTFPLPYEKYPIEDCAVTLKQVRDLAAFLRRLCGAGILKYPDNEFNRKRGCVGEPIVWSQITMHEINSEVIKRVIPKEHSCSWAELVSQGRRQKRRFFCSHNWGESFRHFAMTLEEHSVAYKVRGFDAYWICVFANDQWSLLLGDTLAESPFFRALRGSDMTVVMMDKASAVLKRLWCIFEMHETLKNKQGFEFWTPLGRIGAPLVSSGPSMVALQNMDVARADASDEVDMRRILNHIAGVAEMSGITQTGDNKVLRAELPRGMHEKELLKSHQSKFQALNASIVDASRKFVQGPTPTPSARKPSSRPSWLPCIHRASASSHPGPSLEPTNKSTMVKFPPLDPQGRSLPVRDQITPVMVEDRELRGISLEQFRHFLERLRGWLRDNHVAGKPRAGHPEARLVWEEPCDRETMIDGYDLEDAVVLPMTKEGACAYVELVAEAAQPPEWFVSVQWAAPLKELVSALEWHAEARRLPDSSTYYMFQLSERRHRGDEACSPLQRIVNVQGVVCVLSESERTLERAWVLFELGNAMNFGKIVDIATMSGCLATTAPLAQGEWCIGHIPYDTIGDFLNVAVERAAVTKNEDREYIIKSLCLGRGVGALEAINTRMRFIATGAALREAAMLGDVAIADKVFSACPAVSMTSTTLRGSLGEGPVHIAAASGHSEMLKLLLDRSANVNDQDAAGETPLHYAVLAGQSHAVAHLLDARADPRVASFAGERPLDVALQNPAYFCCGIDATTAAPMLEKCLNHVEVEYERALNREWSTGFYRSLLSPHQQGAREPETEGSDEQAEQESRRFSAGCVGMAQCGCGASTLPCETVAC